MLFHPEQLGRCKAGKRDVSRARAEHRAPHRIVQPGCFFGGTAVVPQKMCIRDRYGVVKCEKARAAALDGAHILGRRDSKFDAELLVDNRPEVARLYPGILTEQATIDDIMTFFAKGAYDA